MRIALISAALTGTFCAGFAVVIDAVTDALMMNVVIALAFVSGFPGSLFARHVLRARK